MPLYSSGRTFNPYASDSPAAKRRRLEAAEEVLTATGFPEIAGVLETASDVVNRTGDQVVPGSNLLRDSSRAIQRRASRLGMAPRMRFGRRGRRRRTTENSRTFRRVVKWKESKQIVLEPAAATLTAGDNTTRTLRLFSPWQVLAAGDASTNRDGDTIFCRGFKLSLGLHGFAQATDFDVIVTYFKSVVLTDTTTGGTNLDDRGITYGNTTTSVTNPTQGDSGVVGTVNLPFYNDTVQPFVGGDIATTSNPDIVKIIKRWKLRFRPQGQTATQPFKSVHLWCPLNRIMTYENIEGTVQAGQFFTHGWQYYYSIAVHSGNPVANTSLVSMTKNTTLYWKEW